MLTFEQMFVRFVIAIALGALLGLERELVGKEAAGVRTTMLVTSGAAIFAMIALTLPYITAATLGAVPDATALNSAFAVIANIVVGVGFLGAGLIIKMNDQPHGVTTAALIWTAAGVGALVGIGLTEFAVVAAVLLTLLLYLLRKLNISESLEKNWHSGK
ncbi:MAG TPA: MgtC/SapB family protein [Candidatus Paceibacterota bacterium]|nr:MgtC/SapB family protein [Candidatus Paceibacterota bacterium]